LWDERKGAGAVQGQEGGKLYVGSQEGNNSLLGVERKKQKPPVGVINIVDEVFLWKEKVSGIQDQAEIFG